MATPTKPIILYPVQGAVVTGVATVEWTVGTTAPRTPLPGLMWSDEVFVTTELPPVPGLMWSDEGTGRPTAGLTWSDEFFQPDPPSTGLTWSDENGA
jgi:hypothetical protein